MNERFTPWDDDPLRFEVDEVVGECSPEPHDGYGNDRPDADFDAVLDKTAEPPRLRPEKPILTVALTGFVFVTLMVFGGAFLGRFDTEVQLAVIAIYSGLLFRFLKRNRRG